MLYVYDVEWLLEFVFIVKLFIVVLMFDCLGVDQCIVMWLLVWGLICYGCLDGMLVFYGMGDFMLGIVVSVDWVDWFVMQLFVYGVCCVYGDLVVDDIYFVGLLIGLGWEVGDLLGVFVVLVVVLSVDENSGWFIFMLVVQVGCMVDLVFDLLLVIFVIDSCLIIVLMNSVGDFNFYWVLGSDMFYVFGSLLVVSVLWWLCLVMNDLVCVVVVQLCDVFICYGVIIDGQVCMLYWLQDDIVVIVGVILVGEIVLLLLGEILCNGLKCLQNFYLQNLLLMVGVQVKILVEQFDVLLFGFIIIEVWGLCVLCELFDCIGIVFVDV